MPVPEGDQVLVPAGRVLVGERDDEREEEDPASPEPSPAEPKKLPSPDEILAELPGAAPAPEGPLLRTFDGVRTVLPAHGLAFDDLSGRAESIKRHHHERLEKLRTASADLGRGTPLDVARANALVESTEASLPALQGAIEHSALRIATLAGRTPRATLALLAEAAPGQPTLARLVLDRPQAILDDLPPSQAPALPDVALPKGWLQRLLRR